MTHPAILMLKVWGTCLLLYLLLPFQMVDKALTVQGCLVLAAYLGAFCAGAVGLFAPAKPATEPAPARLAFSRTDRVLVSASVIASLAYLLDLRDKNVLDLAVAYEMRSDQAGALLEGAASASSMMFQIGFLTYPAAYAYAVRSIVFEKHLNAWRLAAFGFLPIVLATLATGGRSPLLYGLVIAFLSMSVRRFHQQGIRRVNESPRAANAGRRRKLLMAAVGLAAMVYFVAVFFTRAAAMGGGEGMFRVAEQGWGVTFRGAVADVLYQALGPDWTYIVFVFSWYIVQGLPMASHIFSAYHGPMQFGIYGIDIVSALARRVDGSLVASHFDALQQIGIYGFYPAAWGSLHVDLGYLGIAASALWGVLAGWVYRRIRAGLDARWLLFAPFVVMGILFSFINTPIGFANGLITHLWVVLAFAMAKRRRPASAASPATPPFTVAS
ncbi:oligosaccharide repeat unit polymerase [Rhizobacter sp. Root1221]|uniref:oligosaccharide repeat unit polymerase n=1 Tax=Rhizobacter sp. Root1221 TaxID=1736433 RepID=UPI0006FBC3BC|nr:oligosaccharide repeat unit polymerase [Rhizobacter sp. Root1221]KQV95931.1 hypothetical protein ASC87_05190 [Rhizobacter sp. Root1221]